MRTDPEFIVAEVSKNWVVGEPWAAPILAQRFETVINTNYQRGYVLHDWKLSSMWTNAPNGARQLNETIIAVFVRRGQ